ncbi:arrestin domain-containing protein 3-like [Echeneis naucrates]|uniref:Arrestin domain-containing protein 3-like n=1 Tax=Echeneis naucrates TaxID=173247 RepID=A0A665T8X7_ECHNA|nr:arrestin domain-containing protein 3-like [Echeneis naucrates]
MTIKNLSIEYDAVNSQNTFTNGDTINGRIIVETSKETRIQSLIFVAKGKAHVCWHEHYGQYQHYVYWSDEKYYEVKHHILREAREDGNDVLSKGRHVFPFSFKIPDRKLPSSFKSSIGKIVHKLRAELRQSMKLTKKAKVHFTFVSKADMDTPGLMEPQHGSKDKAFKVFATGNVSMDAHTRRMGYKQGEDFKVTVEVNNKLSRPVKPKFILYEKRSYFAMGRRKVVTKNILKEKLVAIAPSSNKTVTKVISIPRELPSSILNCSIIKLEYRLKIYLDIKCAANPQIKFPIVVMPETLSGQQPPAASVFGFEAFGQANPPSWSSTPHRAAPTHVEEPPPYGAHAMYPFFPYSDKK